MRLRDLEAALQRVKPFDKKLQKIDLEQFPTSWHIASRLIQCATENGDIEEKFVVDLGTGTSMLGIGCALMGAQAVLGLDADIDALNIARENIEESDVEELMDLVLCDVCSMPLNLNSCEKSRVDTVVMNPPFGTRNKGIDIVFLEKAMQLRPKAIYSLHKTSTRKFLLKKAAEWGLQVEVMAELKFDIPKMYKHHKQKSLDVEVDFIRFELPDEMREASPPTELGEASSTPPAPSAAATKEGRLSGDRPIEEPAAPPAAPDLDVGKAAPSKAAAENRFSLVSGMKGHSEHRETGHPGPAV